MARNNKESRETFWFAILRGIQFTFTYLRSTYLLYGSEAVRVQSTLNGYARHASGQAN